MIKENEYPVKGAKRSRESSSPLDEEAHLPPDVTEAAQFASDNESNFLKFFRGNQIAKLKQNATRCSRVPEEWADSFTRDQRMAQGKANPPTSHPLIRVAENGGTCM